MCDFSSLSEEEKKFYHEKLLEYANNFGGTNYFLQLLEAIRDAKVHPLISPTLEFKMPLGSISWSKVIFNDKLQLLLKERLNESKQNNLLPSKDAKNYKKVLNLVRTLKPIVFKVQPSSGETKEFYFQPFDIIDENTTKLNPIFDAIFFCSIATVKRVLSYKAKA
jgi:hypothetical protein